MVSFLDLKDAILFLQGLLSYCVCRFSLVHSTIYLFVCSIVPSARTFELLQLMARY